MKRLPWRYNIGAKYVNSIGTNGVCLVFKYFDKYSTKLSI